VQCYRCGKRYSVNEVKHTSEIDEIVQPINDNDPHFVNTDKKKDESSLGISRYKNRRQVKHDPNIELAIKTYGESNVQIHKE